MLQKSRPTPTRRRNALAIKAFCTAVSALLFLCAEVMAWRVLTRARGNAKHVRLAAFISLLGISQVVAWLHSLLEEFELE